MCWASSREIIRGIGDQREGLRIFPRNDKMNLGDRKVMGRRPGFIPGLRPIRWVYGYKTDQNHVIWPWIFYFINFLGVSSVCSCVLPTWQLFFSQVEMPSLGRI